MTILTEDQGKVESVREEEKRGEMEERREHEVSSMQAQDTDIKVSDKIPDSVGGGEGEEMEGQVGEDVTDLSNDVVTAEEGTQDVTRNKLQEGQVTRTEKDEASSLGAERNNPSPEEKDADERKDTKGHDDELSLDDQGEMQRKDESMDRNINLGQGDIQKEDTEINLQKEKSRKGKQVVMSDDIEKDQSVVFERNSEAELASKEKDGNNLQSNLAVKEEKSKRREKSLKPEKVDGPKKVENTGDGDGDVAQVEEKRKHRKEKRGKNSSERMRRKLEKINAKIVRILAKKDDYTVRLEEALEREKLEAENAASQDLEAQTTKSTTEDTSTAAKKEEVPAVQVPRIVHSPNCVVSRGKNGPPSQQTRTASVEPYPPNFKEEMTQQELQIIQSITKR